MNTKKTLLASLVGVFAASGAVGVMGQEEVATAQTKIDEIVVTANKRAGGSSLQDTAIAMSVLSSETIENRGLVSASDYLPTVPGVAYTDLGTTQTKIVIRGLSTGFANAGSSVGSYLGEIPLGTGRFDVKLVDIDRVEVLKGPQGTLYGADAFSGIVRNMPVAPNLQEMEGNIKVSASAQEESDDFNNSVVGAFNIPLVTDELALRVAAYRFENAGYIDAISTPELEATAAATGSTIILEDDLNDSTFTGARATLLWSANDQLDLTLTLGTQDTDAHGGGEMLVGTDYKATYLNTPHGMIEEVELDYGNILVEYDLGWASLMSATSVFKGSTELHQNFSTQAPGSGFDAVSSNQLVDNDRFVEELRLASQFEGPWQFVAGFFYEDFQEDRVDSFVWDGSDAANFFGGNPLQLQTTETELEQTAVFGEISYAFNEQWELTVGGRYFDYERTDEVANEPSPFVPGGKLVAVDAGEDGTTYKANLSYTPNEDTLIYAQWSQGFRLGKGQEPPAASICDVDPADGKLDGTDGDLTTQIDSDTTENFEIGAKFTLMDNRLTLNTAVFDIDWIDLPASIQTPGTDTCPVGTLVVNNLGEANSKGVEMEVNYLVTQQLALNLAASYIEAEWKDLGGSTVATTGESLTFSPKVNANLGVQYDFDLASYPAFARTDISYVGEYETAFKAAGFSSAGDYVNVGMRLGLDVDQWSFALFGSNLTNEEGVTGTISVLTVPTSEFRITPRRIGLEASYRF